MSSLELTPEEIQLLKGIMDTPEWDTFRSSNAYHMGGYRYYFDNQDKPYKPHLSHDLAPMIYCIRKMAEPNVSKPIITKRGDP